jgi:hypothetical protein
MGSLTDKILWNPFMDKVAEVQYDFERKIDDFAVDHPYLGFFGSLVVSYVALGVFMHYNCQGK